MANNRRNSLIVVAVPGEKPEEMIKRFVKGVRSSGILDELRDRQAFEKPSVRKKRKAMRARFARLSER